MSYSEEFYGIGSLGAPGDLTSIWGVYDPLIDGELQNYRCEQLENCETPGSIVFH